MKKLLLLFGIILFNQANAQLIIDNTTVTPAQLVQNTLLGSGITVSNITFNGSAPDATVIRDQVGLFQNGSSTNIGFDSGVILATGKAQLAIGPNTGNNTNVTANPIQGDADLALLASSTIRNKAVLEFDFIPQGQNLSFDFVFASEEYPTYANSTFNDVFGFFLSGPGLSGPYSGGAVNIALIPGSGGTAITINNLNNGTTNNGPCEYCAFYINNTGSGQNPHTGPSTIQYNGFTVSIAALANVQCGETYHIKLAIANVGDNALDSAVFLKANSFNTNPLSLPPDFLASAGNGVCQGETKTICSGLGNSVVHNWTWNGAPYGGNGECITVSQPGLYCVTAYPFGPGCPVTDCITVEYLPPLPVNPPNDLYECPLPLVTFDLTQNTPVVMGSFGGTLIGYFPTYQDAFDQSNIINNPTVYPGTDGEDIWISVEDPATGCFSIQPFILHILSPNPVPNPVPNLVLCDDISNNGIENFNLTPQTAIALGTNLPANYTITYHLSQADANLGIAPINPITSVPNSLSNPQTIYIRMVDNICSSNYGTTSFQLVVTPNVTPVFNPIAPICSGATLSPLPTTSTNGITGTWSPALNNTATTTYTFTPDVTQCATTATTSITVLPQPNATVTGGASVIQNSGPFTGITFTGSNGIAPYTFMYNINGAIPNQTITTTTGNSVSLSLPTSTSGIYNVNLVGVQDNNTPACSRLVAQTATLVVLESPTATVTGSTTVCQNGASPSITFTASNGNQPYSFTYNINGVAPNITTPPSVGNIFVVSAPTNVVGTFNYNLVSVQDANSTQPQSGTATINVISAPTINTPAPYQVCDDNNDGISCFDLTTITPQVTSDATLLVTYHETATNAQTGANPLSSPYCNISNTLLHIRVIHPAAPACYSTTTLQLVINP
ncbi:MAG: choice-of-anchor L domain-containing protein, partial [Bacteroidota bacterium]